MGLLYSYLFNQKSYLYIFKIRIKFQVFNFYIAFVFLKFNIQRRAEISDCDSVKQICILYFIK